MRPLLILTAASVVVGALAAPASSDYFYYRSQPQVMTAEGLGISPTLRFPSMEGMAPGEQTLSTFQQLPQKAGTVSAKGGRLRICEGQDVGCGPWVVVANYQAGKLIQLSADAPEVHGTSTTVSISGSVSGTWLATSRPASVDAVPDDFSFPTVASAELNSVVLSQRVRPVGYDVHLPVTASGGEIRICGDGGCGAWRTSDRIHPGDAIEARLVAASSYSTSRRLEVNVGAVRSEWLVTTRQPPILDLPSDFTIASNTNVALSPVVNSAYARIEGIGTTVSASSQTARLRVCSSPGDCGSWSSTHTVENGQYIQLSATSPSAPDATAEHRFQVGRLNKTWQVSTEGRRETPNPIVFNGSTGVQPGNLAVSNYVQVAGINVSVPVSSSTADIRICTGVGTGCSGWTRSGQVTSGQYIALQTTAPASFGTSKTVSVQVGPIGATWSVTSDTQRTVPNQFNLGVISNAEVSQTYASNTVTVSGINTPILARTSPGISMTVCNSGSGCVSGVTSATVSNGTTITLYAVSNSDFASQNEHSLTVGSVMGIWTVRTRTAVAPYPFNISDVNGSGNPGTRIVQIMGAQASYPIRVSGTGTHVQWMACTPQAAAPGYRCPGTYNSSGSGTFVSGNYLLLRMTLPVASNRTFNYRLQIGDMVKNITFTRTN